MIGFLTACDTGDPYVEDLPPFQGTSYYQYDTWPDSVDCEPGDPNPDWVDTDNDGVPDKCDNCPCTDNPEQHDADSDGDGDLCDAFYDPPMPPPPPGTPTPDGDEDGDGIPNDIDPCQCDPANTCDQCPIQFVELPIYGLGRIGVAKPEDVIINDPSNQGPVYSRRIGEKFYELTDHIGNVRMVISDIKRSVITGGVPGKFFADVHSYMSPYPYGMPQPGRWWDSSLGLNAKTTYRYGFNGMETDPEVEGQPHAHLTTMFRQYDPRSARWWSNDPITHSWESPYAAMAGNPIALADPLGLEGGTPTLPEWVVTADRDPPAGDWLTTPQFGSGSRYEELVRQQQQRDLVYDRLSGTHATLPRIEQATVSAAEFHVGREIQTYLDNASTLALLDGDATAMLGSIILNGIWEAADDVHVTGATIDHELGFVDSPPNHLSSRAVMPGEFKTAVEDVVLLAGAAVVSRLIASASRGAGIIKPTIDAASIPEVTHPRLANIVRNLYKGASNPNRIGTGSTADAIRNELATGLPTGGKFHTIKGREAISSLKNWLRRNPSASGHDRAVAERLLLDLQDAFNGN